MKLTTLYAVVAFILLVFASPLRAQLREPVDYFPEKWQTFEFADEKFKIRFPGQPKVSRLPKDQDGVVLGSREFEFTGVTYMYAVAGQFAVDFEKAGKALEVVEASKKSGVGDIKNQVPGSYREADISVKGHPGKSVELETTDGIIYRARFFIANDRMYVLSVGYQKPGRNMSGLALDQEKIAAAFLDSFDLL